MKPISLTEPTVEEQQTSGAVKTLILGTRGSKLALWQSNWMADRLRELSPTLEVELRIFTTQGDQIQDRPLKDVSTTGDEGIFVRELEEALQRGEIDLAVHSLKDLPHLQPEGLTVPSIPSRVDVRDALLTREGKTLDELPQGARIGTGSARRASQLLAYRPDFKILPLRGNVDTRIRKMTEGYQGFEYDAIILAAAGLDRLGRGGEITQRIPLNIMLPAPGQGALAPECRADNTYVLELLAKLNLSEFQAAVECEKAFMAGLGGGCQTPVACFAEVLMQKFVARGFVGQVDGSKTIHVEQTEDFDGTVAQAHRIGTLLAEAAKEQGAMQILEDARTKGFTAPRA
ncbi:MAG: hydroxymethylbilane synthase [Chloroflexota bacterium]|nr:hydroxymethylbilane synthase [Chloroflexota bacterium]